MAATFAPYGGSFSSASFIAFAAVGASTLGGMRRESFTELGRGGEMIRKDENRIVIKEELIVMSFRKHNNKEKRKRTSSYEPSEWRSRREGKRQERRGIIHKRRKRRDREEVEKRDIRKEKRKRKRLTIRERAKHVARCLKSGHAINASDCLFVYSMVICNVIWKKKQGPELSCQ